MVVIKKPVTLIDKTIDFNDGKDYINGGSLSISDLVKYGKLVGRIWKIYNNPLSLLTYRKRTAGLNPPHIREFLKKHGNDKITNIKIVRTPLNSFTNGLMNVITLGAYKKAVSSSPYDTMFHLSMIINNKYTLDKQEVIKIVDKVVKDKSSAIMEVPITNKDLSINELLDKTRLLMGDVNYTDYNINTNNCQSFILSILKANDLLNDKLKNFIYQDADLVLKNVPSISTKIATLLTDAGAIGNVIIEGEAIKTKKQRGRPRKLI